MKLGAQLYSLKNYLATKEDTQKMFHACRAMGYENLQYSGRIIETAEDAAFLRTAADNAELSITVATFNHKQLTEEPALVVKCMQLLGAQSVMVSVTPPELRNTPALAEQFLASMEMPTKVLLDAGFRIAYHNHNYEFTPWSEGFCMMDLYLERCHDWLFLLDTCWAQHAGADVPALMDKIGANRLRHVHIKDMSGINSKGTPIFCPCGSGILDLPPLVKKCAVLGVEDLLVEQDNASTLPDPLGQMEESCRYLHRILGKEV